MKIRPLTFLSPFRIIRAIRYRRKQRHYDKSAFDLELYLYSRILRNDMLHYGYFNDTDIPADEISIAAMQRAQMRYARLIADAVNNKAGKILDAGCGMGGLTGMLLQEGLHVEALTPNDNQAEHMRSKYPDIPIHHCKYEDLDVSSSYDTVIHSESLQYIGLADAFDMTEKVLERDGLWIITDYFRRNGDGVNTSGHFIDEFSEMIKSRNWEIVEERDITENVLPTLKLIRFYADRFLLPLKHFGLEKFRFKKPFWYAMTDDVRSSLEGKIEKELASIDPTLFREEKKYMFYILQKANH